MSNATEARRLLRAHRYGALSTLSVKLGGYPFGSITPYAVDHDGSLLLLISGLAEHCKNIRHDPRVSLITHNQLNPDIQMQGRVTVVGEAHLVEDAQLASQRYLRLFPDAAFYLTLGDFAFYRIQPSAIRYIGGVGRIHWLNMESYGVTQAAAFAAHEARLLDEINTNQQQQLATLLHQHHGVESSDAAAVALDCDGLDVSSANQVYRLDFVSALGDPMEIKPLHEMAFLPDQCTGD